MTRLVETGLEVHSLHRRKELALNFAAKFAVSRERGDGASLLPLLVGWGGAVDAPSAGGETALHYAVQAGDAVSVAVLLELGADAGRADSAGNTALHKACQELVHAQSEQLLDRRMSHLLMGFGEDPGQHDSIVVAELHRACQRLVCAQASRQRIVRLLLDHGACVGAFNNQGMTALHVLLVHRDPQLDTDLLRLLLQHGADPNQPLPHEAVSETPQPYQHLTNLSSLLVPTLPLVNHLRDNQPSSSPDTSDLPQPNQTLSSHLFSSQRLPELSEPGPLHPLLFSLQHQLFDFAELLLEFGADANVRLPTGEAPLHLICRAAHTPLFKLALAKGGDLRALDDKQFTPLRYAVESGCKDMVALCIESGASGAQRGVPLSPARPGFTQDPFPHPLSPDAHQHPSPIMAAFLQLQPDVWRMLYSSGCFHPRELALLRDKCALMELQNESDEDEVADWKEDQLPELNDHELLELKELGELEAGLQSLVEFALRVSQSPPSLQLMCSWKISSLIGCGSNRKSLLCRLGLPVIVRDLIL